jgi:GAF domain-containing protein
MRIDPADLAESIGTLADLDPDRGLTEGMDRVVAAATTLFGADTTGLMLLAKDGSLAAASAFDQQGELAELTQEQLGHGPCMEAFTRGLPVVVPDLGADSRFDRIAFALRSAGIRGALSVPVEVLGGPIGTLDLFTVIPRAWDDSEVAAARAYAGVVASLLGSAVAAHASSRLATQLQTALDSRVLIEQAKGSADGLREGRCPNGVRSAAPSGQEHQPAPGGGGPGGHRRRMGLPDLSPASKARPR